MTSGTSGGRGLWAAATVPIGAAVDAALLDDQAYVRTLLREFNAVTPENAMKWGPVHPTEDGWDFEPADRIVDFAETHGLKVHGHALVWHEQLPGWISSALTRPQLARALGEHVETLVGRYRGRVAAWDVVNEAVGGRGRLRGTLFLRTLGAGYLAEAFRLAHAADPDARLYYNDYGAEAGGAKSDAVYALARRLLDEGVPIHGVGLQMHLRAGQPPDPSAIRANVARLAALGLAVRISEMDVRIRRVRRPDRLAVQRAVYRDAITAGAGAPGFAGVTVWGVSDAHSWIDARFGEDDPLLFDADYAPKPAYYGVLDALTEGHPRTPRFTLPPDRGLTRRGRRSTPSTREGQMSDKATLLREGNEALRELHEVIDGLAEADMREIWFGTWGVREILAHISGWHEAMTPALRRIANGEAPYPPGAYDDGDAWNARFVEEQRGVKAVDLRARVDATHQAFLAAADAVPAPHFEPGGAARDLFDASGPAHYREHTAQIQAWRRIR